MPLARAARGGRAVSAGKRIGVVAIGRNEGERLRGCLQSVIGRAATVVYVDSGSSDGSAALARGLGCSVVELDRATPFTAARARNMGFAQLRQTRRDLAYVQFVDGDCEVLEGWLEAAVEFLDAHPDVAAVCGRRRERYPDRSPYNLLCDMEWDTPVGETRACGGDVAVRAEALDAVKGYREGMIAGEDPELCVRLRAAGWRIWRLDRDMTLHDAAMTRFRQWWRRTLRAGHAFAEGAYLHGATPERHAVRESLSAWFWGVGVPVLTLCLVPWQGARAFAVLAIYPLQIVRLALRGGRSPRENWWRAVFLVLGKFPEALGQMKFWLHLASRARPRLIEYK